MGECQSGRNLREFLLIGVHRRFHFLLRDQSRNPRRVTIVILERSAPDRVPRFDQGPWLKNQPTSIMARRYSRPMIGFALLFGCSNRRAMFICGFK
jgi:hypothetical protein